MEIYVPHFRIHNLSNDYFAAIIKMEFKVMYYMDIHRAEKWDFCQLSVQINELKIVRQWHHQLTNCVFISMFRKMFFFQSAKLQNFITSYSLSNFHKVFTIMFTSIFSFFLLKSTLILDWI